MNLHTFLNMPMNFGVALPTRLSQKISRLNRTCVSYLGNKKLRYCFYNCFTYFYCYRHFKDSKFCCRLSLFVPVYFYRYLHTYKTPLPVKTISFLFFFYRYYWYYRISLPVSVILVLFNWRTGKTKTHILLHIMQHPRHFLIFDINFNKFAVS